jgi:histidine triad (HIT) family protein
MNRLDPDCDFCAIIAGTRDAEIVYRDEDVVAFLDKRPLFAGHTLVVPAWHVETLGELPDHDLARVMRVVRALSRAMESGLMSQGSFVAINNRVSQSVPHLHVHVVPRVKGDGLRGFFWPRSKYAGDDERHQVGGLVRQSLERELESDAER